MRNAGLEEAQAGIKIAQIWRTIWWIEKWSVDLVMVIIGVENDQEVTIWELALVIEEEKEFMVVENLAMDWQEDL